MLLLWLLGTAVVTRKRALPLGLRSSKDAAPEPVTEENEAQAASQLLSEIAALDSATVALLLYLCR
jgi:hypothetical protein